MPANPWSLGIFLTRTWKVLSLATGAVTRLSNLHSVLCVSESSLCPSYLTDDCLGAELCLPTPLYLTPSYLHPLRLLMALPSVFLLLLPRHLCKNRTAPALQESSPSPQHPMQIVARPSQVPTSTFFPTFQAPC